MRRTWTLAILGVLATAGAAWAAATIQVDQKNLHFSVGQVTIDKGDSIVFLNNDDTSHNITVAGQGLNVSGGLQKPGEPFRLQLVKSGTYTVTCKIHPRMKMTVTVQ